MVLVLEGSLASHVLHIREFASFAFLAAMQSAGSSFNDLRFGESLAELGVIETAAGTLRCVHCEKPLQSYYDVVCRVHRHSRNHYLIY